MNWNQGYNVDLGYTYGYYREQDPEWMNLTALIKGIRPPTGDSGQPIRYLELGCGQGVSLCMMAARYPTMEFVGVDFNPQHISHAEQLAGRAGLANVRFLEADFVELAREWPHGMGSFDYVAAHGIYSWIAPAVLQGLIATIARATRPGALVYLSYNTLPGWISTMPVQHLLRMWQVKEQLPSRKAIDLGRSRLQALIDAGAAITKVLPGMRTRLDKFPQLDKSYLIQEYLHDNWNPKWFDEIAEELMPAKLRYVGTATASDWYLAAMLPDKLKDIHAQYEDAVEKEVMLDVMINQAFRRDVWVRGATPLWSEEQTRRLGNVAFQLIQNIDYAASDHAFKFETSGGSVTSRKDLYASLYGQLQSGRSTVDQLLQAVSSKPKTGLPEVMQAIGLMLQSNHIAISADVGATDACRRLNGVIAHDVLAGAPYKQLLAAKVPCVATLSDSDIMMLALLDQLPEPTGEELGRLLSDSLVRLKRGLKLNDRRLLTRKEIEPQAIQLATQFLQQTKPQWDRLGIESKTAAKPM